MGSTSPKVLAVIIAALLHFFLGAAWLTVLKQPWLLGTEKTAEQFAASGMPTWLPYVVSLVCNLLIAYVLGWLILATGTQSVSRGIQMAVLMWVGFVVTTFATEYAFEARSLSFLAINTGYPLVGMMIMGVVLGAWKK